MSSSHSKLVCCTANRGQNVLSRSLHYFPNSDSSYPILCPRRLGQCLWDSHEFPSGDLWQEIVGRAERGQVLLWCSQSEVTFGGLDSSAEHHCSSDSHFSFWTSSSLSPVRSKGGHSSHAAVMIAFMNQLDWATGCPDSCLNMISGYVMRVYLEEIGVLIGGKSKADGLPNLHRYHQSVEGVNRTKRQRMVEFTLPDGLNWNIDLVLHSAGSQAFRPGVGSIPSALRLSGFQTT